MLPSTPPPWRILVARTQRPLATHAWAACNWRSRMVGLLGRTSVPTGEALIFPQCRSIHTWGMRCAIDAVFVDRNWRVVALKQDLRPWRLVWPVWDAWGVIELSAGSLAQADLQRGDQLQLLSQQEVKIEHSG